jgi:hypothetical protein
MDPPSTLAMCSLARGKPMDDRAAGPLTRCVMCDLDYMLLRTDDNFSYSVSSLAETNYLTGNCVKKEQTIWHVI